MNERGPDWWSNEDILFVDEAGQLWEITLGEELEEYGDGRMSHVRFNKVTGELLRQWSTWGGGERFSKAQRALSNAL